MAKPAAVAAIAALLAISCLCTAEAGLGVPKRKLSASILSGGTAVVKLTVYTWYNRYNVEFKTDFRTTNATLAPPFIHAIHNATDDTALMILPPGTWDPNHDDDNGIITAYDWQGTGALLNSNKYAGTAAAAAAPLGATRMISVMVKFPNRFRVKLQDSNGNEIGRANLRMG